MPLWRIAYLTKSGSVSNIWSFMLSILWKFSQSCFNMRFWRSTSSVTSLSLSTTTFSVTSLALSSLSSSAAHLRSSKGQCVQVPTVNCFLYTFIPFKFHLQFVIPFWIFLLQFHLCCQIPLSSVHSYKLSHGFIHKETGNTTRCLAMLCELNKDVPWPVTDQLWKKWCDWLPIMTHIINLHSDS